MRQPSHLWFTIGFFFLLTVLITHSEAQITPSVTPAIPTSPFTAEEEKNHSLLSWDYGVLGEASGWWGYWYPSCTDNKQSPIDIDSTTATDGSNTLTIETVSGEPLSYVGAIVAFKSAFNQLHIDLSANNIELLLRYASKLDEENPPQYLYSKIDIFFPSVHSLDGKLYDGELVYHFIGSKYDPDTAASGTDLTDENTIALSFLLKGTTDGSASAQVETFLSQVYNGADSGSTQLTPLIPTADKLYQYSGTQLHPPCQRNFQVFVSATPIAVESATVTKFVDAVDCPTNDNQLAYRTAKPLDGRTITEFGLDLTTLSPTFNSEAAAVVYRMVPTPLKYTGMIQRYARDMLIAIVAVLGVTCIYLLVERYTYRLPYNLTWTNPSTKSEVFGVPLRYGYETGKPKVDYPSANSIENTEDGSTGDGSGSQKGSSNPDDARK